MKSPGIECDGRGETVCTPPGAHPVFTTECDQDNVTGGWPLPTPGLTTKARAGTPEAGLSFDRQRSSVIASEDKENTSSFTRFPGIPKQQRERGPKARTPAHQIGIT
jgi:hypothetical protein